MSSFDHPIETIHLDDREKRKLIEGLKKPQNPHTGPSRGIRVPYNSACVHVTITNPGGNVVKYSVIPRNLSRRGIAFLHGRFIYPDSVCKITLQTLDQENMTMDGVIVRCEHLAGTIHEVAAAFSTPMDLSLFANLTPAELEGHTEEYENDISTEQIERGPVDMGTVLLVDGYAADRRLYGTFLDRAGYLCRETENKDEAVEVMNRYSLNAAVIDVCHAPEYGFTLIQQLLSAGLEEPIIAISADDNSQTQQAALSAGAQKFLAKPINAEDFIYQINLLVGNGFSGGGADPIVSTLGQDESMRHLLREFISECRETAGTLKSASRVSDGGQVKLICRQLKGAGGGYGFDDVSRSASEVIAVLDNAIEDVEAQKTAIDDLLNVLSRLRVC